MIALHCFGGAGTHAAAELPQHSREGAQPTHDLLLRQQLRRRNVVPAVRLRLGQHTAGEGDGSGEQALLEAEAGGAEGGLGGAVGAQALDGLSQ
jgi:hypothetical protein